MSDTYYVFRRPAKMGIFSCDFENKAVIHNMHMSYSGAELLESNFQLNVIGFGKILDTHVVYIWGYDMFS